MKTYSKKLVVCTECEKPIEDEHLVAFTGIRQSFNTYATEGCCGDMTPLEVGWTKDHSLYFHDSCLSSISGPEFLKKITEPKIDDRTIEQLTKLAGINQ